MSRPPRILSETGLYHIIFKGLNRQNIFEEDEDYSKLLEILNNVKYEYKIQIYAYCLMTNHAHLFIKKMKAGMVGNPEEYIWSSYNDYTDAKNKLTDIDLTLSILSENREKAIDEFKEFHKVSEETDFSITNTKRLTDEQVKRRIIKITGGINPEEISSRVKLERDFILALLRSNGLTIGQLERTTGISRGIITRANAQKQARP